MTFDIYQLDKLDDFGVEDEEVLYEYQDALVELFFESPEGQAHQEAFPEMGFWAAQLIHYGYVYGGVTIPQMTAADVEEVIDEIFPRKISLSLPEEAEEALPELIAFWEYLKRAYKLRNATAILKHLRGVRPADFVRNMFDPSRFGMAKSFVMAGHAAGFDMTDKNEIDTFMHLHNAAMLAESERTLEESSKPSGQTRPGKAKAKRKRKAVKAARRQGRRKKRK